MPKSTTLKKTPTTPTTRELPGTEAPARASAPERSRVPSIRAYGPLPKMPAADIPPGHVALVPPGNIVLPYGVNGDVFRLPAVLAGAESTTTFPGHGPNGIPMVLQARVVSPDQAQQWLDYFPFKHQRSIRAAHVNAIAEVMRDGKFDQTTSIKIAHFDGKAYLLNGQHRLLGVIQSGIPATFTITHLMCKSWDEIVNSYIREDAGLGRSQRDALIASSVTQAIDVPLGFAQRMLSGINLINSSFRRDRHRRPDREQSIHRFVTWKDEIHAYMAALDGVHPLLHLPLLGPGVVGVALVTYRYMPKEAEVFWPRVAANSGLMAKDADHMLMSYLAGIEDRKHEDRQSRFVAGCWNMYIEKTPMIKTRTTKTEAAIRIAGTPYDGKEEAE